MKPPTDSSRDNWFCALSALVVFAAVMSTRPVLEMGINDDWSFAYSSLNLARTGRLTYNGWGQPFLGLQALWGAWAIQLFGFSFTILRLSVLPFAMGCSLIVFRLSRRLGLPSGTALLATLTFALSPLFIPLATSFMTDVPATFFMLLSLFAFVAALQAKHDSGYMAWLAIGTLTGAAGGTIRQVGYTTPLALIPFVLVCSIGKRSKRSLVPYAASLWIVTILTWIACSHWQTQQPNFAPVGLVGNFRSALFHPVLPIRAACSFIMAAILFSLPAAMIHVASYIQVMNKRQIVGITLFAILLFFGLRPVAGPFLGNIVTNTGILDSDGDALGVKPVSLPWLARFVLLALVNLTLSCVILQLRSWAARKRSVLLEVLGGWRNWPAALILLPFTAAYLTATVLFAYGRYDRYVLPLLPPLIFALLACQSRASSKTMAAGYSMILLFAMYGVATTHDYLAAGRARSAAAKSVEDSGVPRTGISAGFEYDAWTQLLQVGHVELNPAPGTGFRFPVPTLRSKIFWFWDFSPEVQPKYFVVYSAQPGLLAAPFPPSPFTAWLPPFHRQMLVQMLPANE